MMSCLKYPKKILSGAGMASLLFASVAMFGGCLSDSGSSDDGKVKITDLKTTSASVAAGTSTAVEGTITSEAALTSISIKVWKGSTDVTTGAGFTVTQTQPTGSAKAWSLKTDGGAMIAVGGAAGVGDYTVKVTAKSGDDSAVASTTLAITGTAVTTEELTLGSNQNAVGGSVDLDDLKVYTHAQAEPISEKIDLYYAHALIGGDKLFTPAQAKLSGFGDGTKGPADWDDAKANATVFRKLDLSESAFSAITTQEAIDNLWAAGEAITGGSDEVEEGSTYIVNTDKAKKVLIRVTAYAAGETGTIKVRGTK
ncbi:MAG: hypothetical protein ABI036_02445 [Fibrobacteria bacterium]